MRLLLFLILCCFGFKSFSQDPIDARMNRLSATKPHTNLFVHFDKNVYTNNETAYFTGYLLRAVTDVDQHRVMAVVLMRNIDSAIIIQDKFLMGNGISFGSITLPDSIQTGDYQFLVYTNRLINGKPEVSFVQPITLKTNIEPPFKATMKIMANPSGSFNASKVLISVTNNQDRFLPEPARISYRYGALSKTAKTDQSSQLQINLPAQANLIDANLYIKIKSQKDSSLISMAIPQFQQKANVKFYPEGGNLVDGLYSTVGWEVKDQHQMPIAVKAFLYQNNQVIDTIETESNGLGIFKVLGDKNATYQVKLIHSELRDSLYKLPIPLAKGISLEVKKAIVGDSIKMMLRSKENQKVTLLIHNFKEVFINQNLEFKDGYLNIKAHLSEIPKGLATITILNEAGKPIAERLFFAHHDRQDQIRIQSDKAIYQLREKVSLKLHLPDSANQAIVSVASVQSNRIEAKKSLDILNYTYLNNVLHNLAVHMNGSLLKDKVSLEQVLLVKGWRRYTWQDLDLVERHIAKANLDSITMTGLVRFRKKPITEAATVLVLGAQSQIAYTDQKGLIDFNNPEFIVPRGKKNFLVANQGSKTGYHIEIHDQFEKMNQSITKWVNFDVPILPSAIPNNADFVIKRNERITTLKEVVIKKNKDTFSGYGAAGVNACGDYVCKNKILNCRNHFGDSENTHPIPGQTYQSEGKSIIYTACSIPSASNDFIKFNGIHAPKEFYHNDYQDPAEPAFFSTLYWNYGYVLNQESKEITFYTSDISGRFKVVVQGIGDKGPVYGEHFFEVKPKNQ